MHKNFSTFETVYSELKYNNTQTLTRWRDYQPFNLISERWRVDQANALLLAEQCLAAAFLELNEGLRKQCLRLATPETRTLLKRYAQREKLTALYAQNERALLKADARFTDPIFYQTVSALQKRLESKLTRLSDCDLNEISPVKTCVKAFLYETWKAKILSSGPISNLLI